MHLGMWLSTFIEGLGRGTGTGKVPGEMLRVWIFELGHRVSATEKRAGRVVSAPGECGRSWGCF